MALQPAAARKQARTSLDEVSKFVTGEKQRPPWLSAEDEKQLDSMFIEIFPDEQGLVNWNTPIPSRQPPQCDAASSKKCVKLTKPEAPATAASRVTRGRKKAPDTKLLRKIREQQNIKQEQASQNEEIETKPVSNDKLEKVRCNDEKSDPSYLKKKTALESKTKMSGNELKVEETEKKKESVVNVQENKIQIESKSQKLNSAEIKDKKSNCNEKLVGNKSLQMVKQNDKDGEILMPCLGMEEFDIKNDKLCGKKKETAEAESQDKTPDVETLTARTKVDKTQQSEGKSSVLRACLLPSELTNMKSQAEQEKDQRKLKGVDVEQTNCKTAAVEDCGIKVATNKQKQVNPKVELSNTAKRYPTRNQRKMDYSADLFWDENFDSSGSSQQSPVMPERADKKSAQRKRSTRF